jgi:DNA-binding winged helix-turn-helix (wHTH) protein
MISYLASQRSIEFSEAETARLIELSGGHAGLLKAILSRLWEVDREDRAPTFAEEPVVQAECRKVWSSLSEVQQAALIALTSGAQADPSPLQRLKRKGLIRESQSESLVFSPLFAGFIRQQTPPATKDTIISRSPPQVQLEGRRIKNLSELEFEMLCYLYENQGRLCTKDELIENVYRQKFDSMTGGVSEAMLQKLISRLRGKIEPEQGPPRYILTVRGEGYKFVEKDDS